jgi:hypothetical protein
MDTDDIFIKFIEKSSIKLLPESGKSSFIFIIKINEEEESPYTNFYSEKVNEIAMKLILFTHDDFYKIYDDDNNDNSGKIKISNSSDYDIIDFIDERNIETEKSFLNEIDMQNKCYDKSVLNLNPICPKIFFSDVIDNNYRSDFIDFLFEKSNDYFSHDILKKINKSIKIYDLLQIGFIGMEYLKENYCTLYDLSLKNDTELKLYRNIARRELIRFSELGFLHNDYIETNFIVNKKLKKVFIIDFGRVTEIEEDYKRLIDEYLETKKWSSLFGIITMKTYHWLEENRFDASYYINYYRWVNEISRSDFEILDTL